MSVIVPETPHSRLFFILARNAPIGVIFRRGPTKWVQIIKWDTRKDTFEPGQWFKGRIYEKRCDLSPDGTKLIYFAQKINRRTLRDHEYTYAWTAISKIPWLTALALWPKGDCWHGGGLFLDDRSIWLNHRPKEAFMHKNHRPPGITVEPNPEACGEDLPVFYRRLERDGWMKRQDWQGRHSSGQGFITEMPGIWEKPHPSNPLKLIMNESIIHYTQRLEFSVRQKRPSAMYQIEGATWADWDHRGRLVFVKEGKLFAAKAGNIEKPKELADFNAARPEPIESPPYARVW